MGRRRSFRSGGRRPSAQQLAAAHRRMVQERQRELAFEEVERVESQIQEVLDAWRELPRLRESRDFERDLLPKPFTHAEQPPKPPHARTARSVHLSQTFATLRTQMPQGRSRYAWIVAAALPMVALAWRDAHVAFLLAILAAFVVFAAARMYWLVRVRLEAGRRANEAWPTEKLRLDERHRAEIEAHAARQKAAEERWNEAEQARIRELRRLLVGELDAIERAVGEEVALLDFPFEADCAIGVDEEDHVMIDIDLPEIEDVVPETQLSVLKDGSLKEVKRKLAARNEAYGTLVTGIAFTVAASAFSSAPTIRTVTVAGHTQRKSRVSIDGVDAYVYEVRFRRETFTVVDGSKLDPIDAVRRMESRIDIAPNGALKALPEPSWAAALWDS